MNRGIWLYGNEYRILTSEWLKPASGERVPCVDLGWSAIPGHKIIAVAEVENLTGYRKIVVPGHLVEWKGYPDA